MLRYGILGLLNYGNMTGYEIMEVFRDSLNFFWSANTSQIYRELQTLKQKGFVRDTVVEQIGKPDKKVFAITAAGKEELKKWLRSYDYGNNNCPLCMKVFFSGELSKEENIDRFYALKASCAETLKQFSGVEKIASMYENKIKSPDKGIYWKMTLDYGIRYATMLNEWCDSCIRELGGEANENTID